MFDVLQEKQAPKTEHGKDAGPQASERSESYVSAAEDPRTQPGERLQES
jgi:hypothetical protein